MMELFGQVTVADNWLPRKLDKLQGALDDDQFKGMIGGVIV